MRYFPDPVTGWVFLAGLGALLATASYTDQRYMKVPKWLSLPALGLGLLASTARGALLGGGGSPVWLLGAGGAATGALDGLLFALAGFAVGFILFLGMWLMGLCGGGDVKLFAALGAWIGPALVVAVLAVSLGLLWLVVVGVMISRLLRGRSLAVRGGQPIAGARAPIVIRYSLIATVAAVPVLLWAFRADLGLAPRPVATQTAEVRHGT
ncbi:MAG: A24 family peptidase [Gemmataceae bacterium]